MYVQSRFVTRYGDQGSKVWDREFTVPGSGITRHGIGISKILEGSGVRQCIFCGIRDHNIGCKIEIFVEKKKCTLL